jgi:hypothetical protein
MRQKVATMAAALVIATLAGASCSDSKPGPSPLPSTLTMTAALSPANEVPAVTGPDSTGSGSVTVTLNVTRDSAGTITGGTADFVVTLSGFPAGTTLTGAHIHQAPAGTNAGVFLSTGLGNGEVTLASGAGGFSKTGVSMTAAQANSLAGGIACYFNVHTTLNLGGAARGQLALQ